MSTRPPLVKDHRVIAASWPLLLIMALMLSLSLASVLIVSWTRSYAHGHALWAMAEHRAMYHLRGYAQSGDAADYQRFRIDLAVPLGDRVARLELQSANPDYDLVRRSFLVGRVPARDIDGLIHLFNLFKYHPYMQHAVALWAEADAFIVELAQTGEQMHGQFTSGKPDLTRVRELAIHADELHERIASPLKEFGTIMGDAARQIVQLLMIFLPLCALALVILGIVIGKALNRRADRAVRALRVLTEKLEFQATHDALTGLANRLKFETQLAAALAERGSTGSQWALMYFDLDQFKVVNDTSGHAAGDELIKQVAWRVTRLAGVATLARLGGDEFGVLMKDCDSDAAVEMAERVREQICSLRFHWAGKTFVVSASIGVLALDENVLSVADALSAADQACYMAKDGGRNRVQLYRADDRQVQLRCSELLWVERLQAALDNDGFTLVAQEIKPVAFSSPASGARTPRRFELLLRMIAADGELIEPMAFIPAAERYGLMPRIDRWVIARACRELAALRVRTIRLPICMINISGASASDPTLADYIAECLQRNGLHGSSIGIELTETVAVGNLAMCAQLMVRLRDMGCPIALDDFGTGMSSFSYLRNLPIDLLKIDRTFIRNIGTDAIDYAMVETIQRIGGIMGVRTVAEGVESEEVLAALALIGVDFAQGFHIRQPVPLAQIEADILSTGDTSRRLPQMRLANRR